MLRLTQIIRHAAVLILVYTLAMGISATLAGETSDFTVRMNDRQALKKLEPWKRSMLDTYLAANRRSSKPDAVSFTMMTLSLMPGKDIYFADGYARGGHEFLIPLLLIADKDKARILDTGTDRLDSDGNKKSFTVSNACTREYYAETDRYDSGSGAKCDKCFNQLKKHSCIDLNSLLTETIKSAVNENKIGREFILNGARCMAILVNNSREAYIPEKSGDIIDERFKALIKSGKQRTGAACWNKENKSIESPLIQVSGNSFSISGVMEITGGSPGNSCLIEFEFSWDGKTIRFIQKELAKTITYIE
ncbi:MAG TPA: hypothetical protein PK514_06660 [Spirochaetota bacterium]|nr:hypothetical protein [Spirochaetota bacterium]